MPEGDDFQEAAPCAVVDEVLGAHEVEASDLRIACVVDPAPNGRLFDEQIECFVEVNVDRTRRGAAVFAPPLGCAMDLPQCSRLNAYSERQGSAILLELGEQLLGGNALFAIGVVDGFFEFSL
jgi:hypothetical protein